MVKKSYDWSGPGPELQPHTARKHTILRTYLEEYLRVRCQIPKQERFRLAIIDAFSGGGTYSKGEPGSPIIFLETLERATNALNIGRAANGMAPIDFECLLVFNDQDPEAVQRLKKKLAPYIARCRTTDRLTIKIIYLNLEFSKAFKEIIRILRQENFRSNVFFNLDQCGNKWVPNEVVTEILSTYKSAEVLLTFAAETLFNFLPLNNSEAVIRVLHKHGVDKKQIDHLPSLVSKYEWRAAVEKIVFEVFKRCAPFVSPFAIHNPDGWQYWLMHFSNQPKARQVYNDLLHENPGVQAHFGRSGLRMLSYDPRREGHDYLFNEEDRERAKMELLDDIPRLISENGSAITVGDFHHAIANETPAHSSDIAAAMIESPDLTVQTSQGRERRSPRGIKPEDRLVLKPQRSFVFMPKLK